jgi:hypothetical protein
MRQALTYDDIQLVPSFSNVISRKDIQLGNYKAHSSIKAPLSN